MNLNIAINGFSHPLLDLTVVSAASSAAGHIAGGTTMGLLDGDNLETAFFNSFEGIHKSVGLGTSLSLASYIGMSYYNGVNPFTNKPFQKEGNTASNNGSSNNSTSGNIRFGNNSNQEYHAFRHTDDLGLNRILVKSSVENYLRAVSHMITPGRPSY